MDEGTYILFLVLGVALVAIDGLVIYRGGKKYLGDSFADRGSARSMARLVTVLFVLAVLGVLALVSTIDFGGDSPLEAIMVRLGVVLLVVAVAHGIAIKVLTRMRDRLDAENLTKQRYDGEHPARPGNVSTTMLPHHDPANPPRTAPAEAIHDGEVVNPAPLPRTAPHDQPTYRDPR